MHEHRAADAKPCDEFEFFFFVQLAVGIEEALEVADPDICFQSVLSEFSIECGIEVATLFNWNELGP